MYKIGFVNYFNSLPIFSGLENYSEIECIFGTPAEVSDLLIKGKVQAGQVPSFDYLLNNEQLILFNKLCISAKNDEIHSVLFFSPKQLNQLSNQTINLTDHSRTSNQLLKVLLNNYGNKEIEYKVSSQSTEDLIRCKKENVLLIGNEALRAKKCFDSGELTNYHCYDLGQLWFELTSLPFVFAVFASKNPLPTQIENILLNTLEKNLKNIGHLAKKAQSSSLNENELVRYFDLIEYKLDSIRHESLQRFCDFSKLNYSAFENNLNEISNSVND
ncbi:MAG: menaquinone biosynthesis protein [Candidatus Caenarcaniphilales bacterium]|nr:menaquinone biosynthesis protein [Candidatus Caenarcaniphilales bacterium]